MFTYIKLLDAAAKKFFVWFRYVLDELTGKNCLLSIIIFRKVQEGTPFLREILAVLSLLIFIFLECPWDR